MNTTATLEDLDRLEQLLAKGIKVIRVIHSDLFGRQRAKQFPASYANQLREGIAYSKMSIAEDLLGAPVDEDQFPALRGHPDLYARIEPETAIIPPWEPDSIWVLASLWENGRRSPLCPRGVLAQSCERMESTFGFRGEAAAEPEFYLFNPSADERPGTPYSPNGVSYTVDRVTDPSGAIGRIHRQLIDFNIGVSVVNREFSPGQFELNLRHTGSQRAADEAFLLKTATKELSILEGLQANFMAKPLTGEEGSSLHIHLSLWDGDENVFAAPERGLNPRLLHAIAGVQQHAPALMAFAAPTVNSYKRLHSEGLSPDTSNFAEDNRYTFVRIPAERGKATRFELRAGDASASPHLLTAAIYEAAFDGMQQGLDPTVEGVPLPKTLGESLDALEQSDLYRSSFGSELVDVYVAIKRREIDAFSASVTDWEWNLYHSHA
ncbi:MAG: glutamine synthetase family protein [Gulosibacter sp.]|uniref:glutamine synthetase family protein n=1 Tax=Gulosibacter sp. TaxID=2817531 RepID=UPI003F8FBEA5